MTKLILHIISYSITGIITPYLTHPKDFAPNAIALNNLIESWK